MGAMKYRLKSMEELKKMFEWELRRGCIVFFVDGRSVVVRDEYFVLGFLHDFTTGKCYLDNGNRCLVTIEMCVQVECLKACARDCSFYRSICKSQEGLIEILLRENKSLLK